MDGRIRCPPILAVSKNGHASPYPLFAGHRPVESITGAIGSETWRVNWIPPITIICFQRYRKSSTVSTFGRMRATGRRTESFLELSCARKRRSQRICPFGKRLGRHWAVDGFRSLMRLDHARDAVGGSLCNTCSSNEQQRCSKPSLRPLRHSGRTIRCV